jgi:hypothetical protein
LKFAIYFAKIFVSVKSHGQTKIFLAYFLSHLPIQAWIV